MFPCLIYLCMLPHLVGLAETRDAAGSSSVLAQIARSYSIELCIYVDKWAFLKWNATAAQQISDTDVNNRAIQVQDIMRKHIIAIIKGVNNIYSGLMEYGIDLDIRVASIHFVMDEVVAETEAGSGEVSNKEVLDRLSDWLPKTTDDDDSDDDDDGDDFGDDRPAADHTMLFTGLNITGNSSDADSLGVARLGQMCDEHHSLSVVEFLPPGAQTTLVVAHEIGHSLNASHDGEMNMTCTNNSYVMDPHVSNNSTHSYVFSPCSAHSILQFLLHLGSTGKKSSCLSTDNTSEDKDRTAPALGSIMSLDRLCQMEIGPDSFLNRASYGDNASLADYSTVCTSVWCYTGENFTRGIISADGFVCGNNKVCQLGFCVESEDEIDVPDSCPYGDAPPYANVHQNVSCPDLAVSGSNASLCYKQFFERSCCASCASAHRPAPDCEYGDKAIWCATSEYPDVCYENDKVCCASCLPFINESRIGCEYGDKASWCATEHYPYVCDLNAQICCESCLSYYNESRIGCEYGDKAAWCATLNYPRGCYGNDHMCCASCPQYHNASLAGCEYGDRAEWCATLDYPRQCYDNDDTCCDSCLQHYNASRLDCQYGDKVEWCAGMDFPRECYGNDHVCCASCLNLRDASDVDCEYGDKADWCEDADYPFVCGLNSQVCCGSCRPYYNESNTGCEYGDKVRGCDALTLPQACYTNAHLCCHTCRPFHRPSATGCEYGDKASWCRQSVAQDPRVCELNSEVCCASCAAPERPEGRKKSPQEQSEDQEDELKDEL